MHVNVVCPRCVCGVVSDSSAVGAVAVPHSPALSTMASSSRPATPSSLSSVVSGLVRAQMGSAVPASVSEADLDAHVAQLILKEAKQKAERYAQLGIAALVAQCVPILRSHTLCDR
jgi:hypothetical protein